MEIGLPTPLVVDDLAAILLAGRVRDHKQQRATDAARGALSPTAPFSMVMDVPAMKVCFPTKTMDCLKIQVWEEQVFVISAEGMGVRIKVPLFARPAMHPVT